TSAEQPDVLWEPPSGVRTRLDDFTAQVRAAGHPSLTDYEDLWRWSTEHMNDFWLHVWRHCDIPADTPQGGPTVALADASMPGAVWFPEVRLNYAEAMLAMPGRGDDDVVAISRSQTRDEVRLTAAELRDLVARVRVGLQRAGVQQ